MRVFALAAGLILGAAIIVVATEAGSKTDTGMCRVVCTPAPAAKPAHHPHPRSVAHHHGRRHARHYARHNYYSYRDAEVVREDWHGQWQPVPNSPVPPPPCNCGEGLRIDQSGFTGGVGYMAAQEGGFMDGYGVMHYGGIGNGPTYNSYAQSFQFNPSRPGPFQPRMMGGAAPAPHVGGFGPHR
jgi:hypothetical protein